MDFHLSKLKPPLPVAVMFAMALVLSAEAQQPGQSIIFASPQTNDASSDTSSLMPQTSEQRDFMDGLQVTKPLQPGPPEQPFPVPQPQSVSPVGQQRMKRLLEDQQNWALVTPEEILGVAKPETDSSGQEKNQTPIERYLDRQNQLRNGGPTNGWSNDAGDSPWNFSRGRQDADSFGPDNNGSGNSLPGWSRFFGGSRPNETSANRSEDSHENLFAAPPQEPTKPDLVQQAAMARFRQLLEPDSASVANESPSPESQFLPVPKKVIDPNITQPAYVPNPVGASFIPLLNGIGRPTGLAPLPGIVTPSPQLVVVPSWVPQPAPWLLQGPQLFVIPQRKF